MSYPKIAEIPRAGRTFWSPETGGKIRQRIGGSWVPKYAYSPFTAKPRKNYVFYADVKMKETIESPPKKRTKQVTIEVCVGSFLKFRNMVLSGEALQRISDIVIAYGGEGVVEFGYWRNKGEPRVVD